MPPKWLMHLPKRWRAAPSNNDTITFDSFTEDVVMAMTDAERQRLWRKKNPELALERGRKWREANREKARATSRNRDRRWREANPDRYLFNHCRRRAKRDGRPFSITLDEVRALLAPMVCSVTGLKLMWDWPGSGRNPVAPSIDRIDSGRGYAPENVRLVCWAFNNVRGNNRLTDEEARARVLASHA